MLRLIDVRKSFGSTVAVDGLSLEVRAGEVFGLLGPNGAGKTTTISMAMGLLRPDSGRVLYAHDAGAASHAHSPADDPRVRAMLGVAPQALALYDDLTGEENLFFFGRLYGLRGQRLRERVDAVLEGVGLSPRRRDRVRAYSGGMKRRLNLGAALVHDPPVVLLDEPTAGVDPQSRNNILDLVRALKGAGKTVVYTTHYMEEAQRLCDRVAIVDRGRLLALGSVDALVHEHGGRSVVRVRTVEGEERVESDDPMREAQQQMARRNGALLGLAIERPDLESVFLALTGRRLRD